MLILGYTLAGLSSDLAVLLPGVLPVVLLFSLYVLLAARYVRGQMEKLREYAQSMSAGNSSIELRSLYGFRGPLVTLLLLGVGTSFLPFTPPQYSPVQGFLTQFPWYYFEFVQATFIWVIAYSVYSIYRIGKLPLKLKAFAEDRTLGLKPFATASLYFTGLYEVYAFFLFLPLALGTSGLPFLIVFAGVALLGLAFFLVPLISLRRKLIVAKREKLSWISPRYMRIVQQIEANGSGPIDGSVVNELTVIDKIQRDIQQIHHWPFDTGILTRLTAIILSVIAIILAKIIQLALHF